MSIVQKNLQNTTNKTGCYLFKNINKNVIYVGKAKNIQKRIQQHFQSKNTNIKTASMIQEIVEWETFITDNEKEAFILEHNLIKRYYPKFNIILADDQTYPYIFIPTEVKDPKYFLIWTKIKQTGLWYGPFPDHYSGKKILNLLETLFPLRRCTKQNFQKPCFYYHLQQCSGACFQTVAPSYYQKQIKKVKSFFKGKVKWVKKKYLAKIQKVIKNLQFEQAQKYQNILDKIDQFTEKQKVEFNNYADLDFINFACQEQEIMVMVFFYRQGKLQLKKEGLFSLFNNSKTETIENFLQEIYTYHPLPQEIISPEEIDLSSWTTNYSLKLVHPKKGKKKAILELIQKNAQVMIINKGINPKQDNKIVILENLAKLLKIPRDRIDTIEFLDLSYFDKKLVVAGFSHYLNGNPLFKKNRIYQIQSTEHNEKEHFKNAIIKHYQINDVPKLIILDGSILQLQGAKAGLKFLKKDTNIICLVKDKKHQTNYILSDQRQQILIKPLKTWLFLSKIQNEGHLYVIKNLHLLKRKNFLSLTRNNN